MAKTPQSRLINNIEKENLTKMRPLGFEHPLYIKYLVSQLNKIHSIYAQMFQVKSDIQISKKENF